MSNKTKTEYLTEPTNSFTITWHDKWKRRNTLIIYKGNLKITQRRQIRKFGDGYTYTPILTREINRVKIDIFKDLKKGLYEFKICKRKFKKGKKL